MIRERRLHLELSQALLAKLAGIARSTLQKLESGTLKDIGYSRLAFLLQLVGLSFGLPTDVSRGKKRGLWMATKNTNVSYKTELTIDQLVQVLTTGQIPVGVEAHITHFLEETPLETVIMAVEEASSDLCNARSIWKNIKRLALYLEASRGGIWSERA